MWVRVTAFCFSLSEVNLGFTKSTYEVPEGQFVTVTLESNGFTDDCVDERNVIQAYFEVNISTVDGMAKGKGNCCSLHSSGGLNVLCSW